MTKWDKWNDCHDYPSQVRRQERAREAALTPLSIKGQHAQFQGSEKKYLTFLDACSCPDFQERHKPCKHMYRLAMELYLFPRGDMKTDASAIRIPTVKQAKITTDLTKLVDRYPIEQQAELAPLVNTMISRNEPVIAPASPLITALTEAGFFHAEQQSSDNVKLTIPESYNKIANTICRQLQVASEKAAALGSVQTVAAAPTTAKQVQAASLGTTRSKWVVLALALFLGGLGVHRFYTGKIKSGIVWLLTCGLFGFGWLCDVIAILINRFDGCS